MIKILKIITFSLLLCIVIFVIFVLTQDVLFWYVIDFIRKMRGTDNLVGEDRGTETIKISFKIILPIIYLISLAMTLWLAKKRAAKRIQKSSKS
jgi:hypothetical protein